MTSPQAVSGTEFSFALYSPSPGSFGSRCWQVRTIPPDQLFSAFPWHFYP